MTNSPHHRRRWDKCCPRRPHRQRPSRVLWRCSNDVHVGGDGSGGGRGGGGRGSWHRCSVHSTMLVVASSRCTEDGEQRKRIEGFGGESGGAVA